MACPRRGQPTCQRRCLQPITYGPIGVPHRPNWKQLRIYDEGYIGNDGDRRCGPLGIDFLITTPERLHHLLDSHLLSLSQYAHITLLSSVHADLSFPSTRHLVLDESDRLLSPDFGPQVEPILEACSHVAVQKCFLSATMPAGSEEIARRFLQDGGVRVVVGVK